MSLLKDTYNSLLFHCDGNLVYRALKELRATNIDVSSITEYHAIGSGSIVAILLYIGMSIEEVVTYLISTSIFDITLRQLPMLIKTVIGDKLISMFSIIPTLSQLQDLMGSKSVVNFYVYCPEEGIKAINCITCPDMSCITACSMAYNMGDVYYIQTYCGRTYMSANMFTYDKIPLLTKTFYVHVKSTYSEDNNPTSEQEYFKYSSYNLMEKLLSAATNPMLDVLNLTITSSKWSEAIETKLSIMYE